MRISILDALMFIVLGNITVDEFMTASSWPAPGQTVIVDAPRRDLGGKGANQAIVLKRARTDVRLIAAIGQDDLGGWIVDGIVAEGLAATDLIRLPFPSDRSLIFVGPTGENAIASVVSCAEAITETQAHAAVARVQPEDILVLQGNLTEAATLAACRAARAKGMRTIFNPSPMRGGFTHLLPLIDLLVVNESEAAQLACSDEPDRWLRILHEAGAGDVVVTLGDRGAMALGRSGRATTPAMPVDVIDTTGAGDTFTGVLGAALFARGLPLGAALHAASAAAAVTVTRAGALAAFPTADEIEAAFRSS